MQEWKLLLDKVAECQTANKTEQNKQKGTESAQCPKVPEQKFRPEVTIGA